MKRSMNSALALALLATAAWCGPALAQAQTAPAAGRVDPPVKADKADSTQVTPHRKDTEATPPSLEKLDDNAQRSHDRNSTAAPRGSDSNARPNAKAGSDGARPARSTEAVRDWAAIDKNKDHLISPEEMEAALKQDRPVSEPAPVKK